MIILGPGTEILRRNALVKNQGTKQRVQRILGDCWQWVSNGQCSKGDNCSFRHDANERGKVTPSNPSPKSFMQQNERHASRTRSPRGKGPSGRMSRCPCQDYLKGTCTSSFCEKWHPPVRLFCKTESGCRFGEKCSFDVARRRSGLGAAAWILWLRNEYGIFEKVSYGGCVLKNASAMIAKREALRKGIEHLTVFFPTVVSSFDFQFENSGRTVQ